MLGMLGLAMPMMAEPGNEGGAGAGGGAPEPAPVGNSDTEHPDGDEGLPAEDSLIGNSDTEHPAEGVSDTEQQGSDTEQPKKEGGEGSDTEFSSLSDVDWMGKIALSEEFRKGDGGAEYEINKDFLAPFVPVMREMGLTPEQAGKLVEVYAKLENEDRAKAKTSAEEAEKAAKEALLAKRDELRAESKKTLGDAELAFANRAMDFIKKDDPVFYKMVQTSLLGVHPGFLRLCAMAGRRVADDGLPNPSGVGGGARKTPGEMLFGDAIREGLAKL